MHNSSDIDTFSFFTERQQSEIPESKKLNKIIIRCEINTDQFASVISFWRRWSSRVIALQKPVQKR